jgi:predicted MFS family arabinose efflux permease
VAGGLGAIGATAPLEWVLRFVTWRTVFMAFGTATLVVALLIAWRVPDMPRVGNAVGLRAQFAGVREVFRSGRFWWIAPLGGFGMGSFMAVQGLWAVPWLMEVDGRSRASAAQVLLVMGVVTLVGYVAIGLFAERLARRGVHSRHLFASGFSLNALALLGITLRLPGGVAWWALYGFGAAVNVLGFTALNEGFARHLAARANTALNLVMFGGSFIVQWGIGVLAEAAVRAAGVDGATGLRIAFAVVLACDVLALAWFVRGWRRHAVARAMPA